MKRSAVFFCLAVFLLAPLSTEAMVSDVQRPKSNRVRGDDSTAAKVFYEKQTNVVKQKRPSSASSASAKLLQYRSPRLGVQFSYPSTAAFQDNVQWLVLVPKVRKLIVQVRGQQAPAIPAVYVVTKKVPSGLVGGGLQAIDDVFHQRVTLHDTAIGFDSYIPSFRLESSEDATLMKQAARRYVFTGERQSQKIRGEAYATIIGDTYYEVMLASGEAYFDEVRSVVSIVARSMSLTAIDPSSDRPKGKGRAKGTSSSSKMSHSQ